VAAGQSPGDRDQAGVAAGGDHGLEPHKSCSGTDVSGVAGTRWNVGAKSRTHPRLGTPPLPNAAAPPLGSGSRERSPDKPAIAPATALAGAGRGGRPARDAMKCCPRLDTAEFGGIEFTKPRRSSYAPLGGRAGERCPSHPAGRGHGGRRGRSDGLREAARRLLGARSALPVRLLLLSVARSAFS
jgi:hypothetical protein